jgi:arylamine N-acetyltransferase
MKTNPMTLETPSERRLPVEPLLLLDVDATELFDGESRDWQYCVEHAPWQRPDEAVCEFMLYTWRDDAGQYFTENIRAMTKYGCSKDLIALVRLARERHAAWLMLHA